MVYDCVVLVGYSYCDGFVLLLTRFLLVWF